MTDKCIKMARGGGKLLVVALGVAFLAHCARADVDGSLTFITGGSLNSTAILSVNPDNPDVVFAGEDLSEYEPAYAYFYTADGSGQKYYVCPDLNNEILRPYNVRRTGTGDGATMTVQFQGLTRTKVAKPYTASITVKFIQSGGDIKAYIVRAASLKPLDIELGLDIDAMVDGGDARAVSRPLTSPESERIIFNLSVIAMRKPGEPMEYLNPREGDTIGGVYAGSAAVNVTRMESPSITTTRAEYLPNNAWVVVGENCDLADLDEVEGWFHYDTNTGVVVKACNLRYVKTPDYSVAGAAGVGNDYRLGRKTCQFQRVFGQYLQTLIVQFRQNGANVDAVTWPAMACYIDTTGHTDEVYLGCDLEAFNSSTTPKLSSYSRLATDDADGQGYLGVKNLKVTFRSRAAVANEGYLPNANDDNVEEVWTVVAANHSLSDLAEVEAYYHTGANAGFYTTGVNLKTSGSPSVQFQAIASDSGEIFVSCVGVDFRQNGSDIEARTGRYRNWYMFQTQGGITYSEVKYGVDFYAYSPSTTPARTYYGSYAADDSSGQRGGIKDIRLKFATGGIVYAAAHAAPHGNSLTFAGCEESPLQVSTISATAFPSNGVVTVAPYATLTLAGHVANPRWTQYRVLTNGVLKLKGTQQTTKPEQIELDGGSLSLREDEDSALDSGAYLNFVTFKNGANCRGKPARVGENEQNANWIVAGSAPSFCDGGIAVTAAGGDTARTFTLNVKDVAEGADFTVNGEIADFGTVYSDDGYWNVHVAKNGEGTLALGGGVALPNEICVNEGTLLLASNDLFKVSRKRQEDGTNKKAELWLADGAGLATASATTNAVGALVVKGGTGTLDLGADSKLVLTSFTAENGGTLIVSDNLGKGATMRIEGLPVFTIVRNIRCGEDGKKKVRTNTDGNLVPYISGISVAVQ